MEATCVVDLDGEVICIEDAGTSGSFECLGDIIVSILEDLAKYAWILHEPNF